MKCQKCENEAISKQKFCKQCRADFLKEMKDSGYLQSLEGTSHYGIRRQNEGKGRKALRADLWSNNADGIEEYVD